MKLRNCVFTLFVVFVLSACFSPLEGPDASLTVNLGRNKRAVYPPDDETFARLVHTIEVSGIRDRQSRELGAGESAVTFSVEPGTWTVTVKASLDGVPYAEGSDTVEVKAGQKANVAITMRRASAPVLPDVTYTVSFESKGGSAVEPQIVGEGGTAERPENPSREGFGFVDWYTDEAFSAVYDFDTPLTANITLYAKWSQITYTVSFESKGGTALTPQIVGEGGRAVRPVNPRLEGFGFVDWYTDEALTTVYVFETPVTANITLYAKWLPVYTVTFNSNGGSAVLSQTLMEGETAVRPANPTRPGYGFVGWYTDTALSVIYDFDTALTADITLYAKWSTPHTVTFNSKGGNVIEPQIVGEGGTAVRPANPTRPGYGFVGWYRDEALSVVYDFNKAVTADITLYAKWILITQNGTFTIDFERINDLNDITGPALKRSGTRTQTITLNGDYDEGTIQWELYGSVINGNSLTLSLDPANPAYKPAYDLNGSHILTLSVKKAGVPYGKRVIFTVSE